MLYLEVLVAALLCCAVAVCGKRQPNAQLIRDHLNQLNERSRYVDMLKYMDKLEAEHGNLVFDNYLPSLYTFRGVALHSLRDTQGAETAFAEGVKYFPNDTRAWINLSRASALGDKAATSRLLKAKGWVDSYQDFEQISSAVEKQATNCVMYGNDCLNEGPSGTEYTSISGVVHRELSRMSPNAQSSPFVVEEVASLWDVQTEVRREKALTQQMAPSGNSAGAVAPAVRRRLKVGVISSDFGVHPVSSLIRGVLEFIDQNEIELYCFAVTDKMSWWGHNITASVEHFVVLVAMNYEEAAVIIAETGVEVLIDLNGHTLNTGLGIMKHRPALLQMSFLGLPTSSGADFIDYYIGDPVALPAEHATHFTEKLLLLPPCYIATDYAQLLGGILTLKNEKRWSRSTLKADSDLSTISLLFGTFSNSQKLDPSVMHVWMNILSSFPDSKMFMVQHLGSDHAIPHLRNITKAFGVRPDRLTFSRHLPWIYHIQAKTSVDLLLDSTSKNGHTTGLDAVWAGIPMITMAGGRSMPARAGESIHDALESDTGLVYSLKEYEDLAIKFAKDQRRLRIWRDNVERLRSTSTLFDTKRWTASFTRLLESTWEAAHVAESALPVDENDVRLKYNVFHLPERGPAKELEVSHVAEPTDEELVALAERQNILERAMGAGRVPSNANHRFVSADRQENLPRGGIGQGGPSRPAPGREFGTGSPDEFYDGKAHRVTMCSLLEKKTAAGMNIPTCKNSNPEPHFERDSGPADIEHSASSKGADGSEDACKFSGIDYSEYPIPKDIFKLSPLILNVGGIVRTDKMVNVNAQPSSYKITEGEVDVIRLMDNLDGFPDESIDGVYTSHSLEHAGYGDTMMETLKEWHRVLKPGGMLMVSVPDLKTLSRMYLDESLSQQERWMVTRMMYGGQTDQYDYHKVGFDDVILSSILQQSGFCDMQRVSSYNLIHDTSVMEYKGYKISLNMIAKKCSDQSGLLQKSKFVSGIRIPPLPDFKINFTEYDPYE